MTNIGVQASRIEGRVQLPTSKSHSQRAILFASLAQGVSEISGVLHSPDIQAMITACQKFGASIENRSGVLLIEGVNGKLIFPDDVIDAGNSGQVLRFMAGLAALIDAYTVFTGDHSIRYQRKMDALLDGLTQLGCQAFSSRNNGYAPILIKGPLKGGVAYIDGQDSQPVSALLMACAFAKHSTEIFVKNPGEKPWIALTLNWLERMNIAFQASQDFTHFKIPGHSQVSAFNYTVPGDFSSSAFPLVAAAITGGSLVFENLDRNDIQGDKLIFNLLLDLGFNLKFPEDGTIILKQSKCHAFSGFKLDVNAMVDALPILAVLACFAQTPSVLTGAAVVKHKESDRLQAISSELNLMGGQLKVLGDELHIHPAQLHGAQVFSHHDHRIAMALAVAGLGAKGQTFVQDIDCIAKSYPDFVETFKQLGANFAVDSHRV
jgi:3-phosphoshikimate 1-carboxyvinyltransferase